MVNVEASIRSALDDRYDIEGEIGRGGMSIVFRALDLKHNRPVAIKVLKPEVSEALGADRFLREVKLAASLNSPHILPLFDSGAANGHLYYVTPFVEGRTLRDLLASEKQLSLERSVEIAIDIAQALKVSHDHGIVHRDVKPANILIEGDEAVLSDFGVAIPTDVDGRQRMTTSGIVVGTPSYMSPEQGAGESEIDGRSDIYAIGCVLFEMLAGEPPFSGATANAVIARHIAEPPPSVRVVRPDLPAGIEKVVRRCLAKSPVDRYASAQEFVRALEKASTEDEPSTESPWQWISQHRGLLAATVLVLGAVLALGTSLVAPSARTLDPNRIVVFPPHDLSPAREYEDHAPGIAASIGYALEGTEPLGWLEGWDWMTSEQRRDPRSMTNAEMREIARGLGAAYFMDGQTVVSGDTVTLIIRLHEVASRRASVRSGESAPIATASLTPMGLRAVARLIPRVVGHEVEPSEYQEHPVAALANWGLGLSAYSRAHFDEAYAHFESALELDSTLAVAAVDAALSAMWLARIGDAQSMADLAVRQGSELPKRSRLYAEGVRHYTRGQAESAIMSLVASLQVDSARADGWFALGEVFLQLVPPPSALDSVSLLLGNPSTHSEAARTAFENALGRKPDFWPAIERLAVMNIRGGNLDRAARMLERFFDVEPDSSQVAYHVLVLDCLLDEPDGMDWQSEAEASPFDVLKAGLTIGLSEMSPGCASGALSAVLESDSAASNERWGALLTLQSLLAGWGRDKDLTELLDGPGAELRGQYLYPMDAAAGADVVPQADEVVEKIGTDLTGQSSQVVWVAGTRAAQLRDTETLDAIVTDLNRRVVADSNRLDRLLAEVFAAHLALSQADTATALARFQALTPTGNRAELRWGPWETLAYEWLILARLEATLGHHQEAIRVAAQLDHVHPVVYPAFRPASLSIRIASAIELGNFKLADSLRSQLEIYQR